MQRFGFLRVAACSPRVRVADPCANAREIADLYVGAADQGCDVIVFPELALTGYTCGDLFHQETLLESAAAELAQLAKVTGQSRALLIVGIPIRQGGRLYNSAAVLQGGRILAAVVKQYLPTYQEFYERRWFAPWQPTHGRPEVPYPLGANFVFRDKSDAQLSLGIEICEDLWTPTPPSSEMALAGATVLVNLSASNETAGKAGYRRDLVIGQSGRCIAGYVYSSAGVTESTTDLVFGGHCLIAENGALLAESPRFQRQSQTLIADLDVERLAHDRRRVGTFADAQARLGLDNCSILEIDLGPRRWTNSLRRNVPARPFVPTASASLAERCEEIFATQVAGLAKRLESAGKPVINIGVSGGLDSTLALLVAVKTVDLLGVDRQQIHGVTLPGFGTSDKTRSNAERLMRLLQIQAQTIDIRQTCFDLFSAMGHQPFGINVAGLTMEAFSDRLAKLPAEARHDLVFENVQARVRTLFLMSQGFVLGTGDLSELALGWCTYNGDHMSMYNPNAGVPKTLVRFLVEWAAQNEFIGETRETLLSIAATEISPELLPIGADQKIQSTESTIGPYELHDFFLYHLLRFGYGPRKILLLAQNAKFAQPYDFTAVHRWLGVFLRRFFASQFKRSCVPDGPKIGSASLSPRGDWRMPSDAEATAWLTEWESAAAGVS